MKNNSLFLILAFALAVFGTTSCTKDNIKADMTPPTDQNPESYQKALAGSWQFVEKGVAIVMHDGQACTLADTKNPMIQWENVAADEKRFFTANGGYSHYVNSALTCEGTYKIAYVGSIELTTNCQNAVETVQELTAHSLIVRDGISFSKYRKLE